MEGDTTSFDDQKVSGDFYPRPHMEGDGCRALLLLSGGDFYPRPHMEGDCSMVIYKKQAVTISTHALTWRATRHQICIHPSVSISTHALTWRATPITVPADMTYRISTHALTWRATTPPNCLTRMDIYFYPRPHMEGDQPPQACTHKGGISTHALTWRATCPPCGTVPDDPFLPTPSHGGRHGQ